MKVKTEHEFHLTAEEVSELIVDGLGEEQLLGRLVSRKNVEIEFLFKIPEGAGPGDEAEFWGVLVTAEVEKKDENLRGTMPF